VVTNGNPAAFSVSAIGSPTLTYQWRINGTNAVNGGNLSGANASTLNLAAVSTSDAMNYDVIVANTFGSATSGIAALTVVLAPTITNQPQSLTVTNGSPALFTVVAGGTAPLAYQWLKGGTNLTDGGNVSGSSTYALALSTTTAGDAGDYTVVITNAYGSATSSVATLTVVVPVLAPSFQSVTLGNGSVNFVWSATPGGTYQLQYSLDLTPGSWTSIGPPVTASGTTLSASDTVGPDPQRFYRVVGQ
jgi:hypothetical protein